MIQLICLRITCIWAGLVAIFLMGLGAEFSIAQESKDTPANPPTAEEFVENQEIDPKFLLPLGPMNTIEDNESDEEYECPVSDYNVIIESNLGSRMPPPKLEKPVEKPDPNPHKRFVPIYYRNFDNIKKTYIKEITKEE